MRERSRDALECETGAAPARRLRKPAPGRFRSAVGSTTRAPDLGRTPPDKGGAKARADQGARSRSGSGQSVPETKRRRAERQVTLGVRPFRTPRTGLIPVRPAGPLSAGRGPFRSRGRCPALRSLILLGSKKRDQSSGAKYASRERERVTDANNGEQLSCPGVTIRSESRERRRYFFSSNPFSSARRAGAMSLRSSP